MTLLIGVCLPAIVFSADSSLPLPLPDRRTLFFQVASTSIHLRSSITSTLNMNAEQPVPDEATTIQTQMNQTANEVSNGFSLIDCLNGDEHNKMVNDNSKAEKKKREKSKALWIGQRQFCFFTRHRLNQAECSAHAYCVTVSVVGCVRTGHWPVASKATLFAVHVAHVTSLMIFEPVIQSFFFPCPLSRKFDQDNNQSTRVCVRSLETSLFPFAKAMHARRQNEQEFSLRCFDLFVSSSIATHDPRCHSAETKRRRASKHQQYD